MTKTLSLNPFTRYAVLNDLQQTYRAAQQDGNYNAAIKAKELLGKELGLFNDKKNPSLDIETLSDEELFALLGSVQKRIGRMKNEFKTHHHRGGPGHDIPSKQ